MTVQSLFRIFSPFATVSFAGMMEHWYILQCRFPKARTTKTELFSDFSYEGSVFRPFELFSSKYNEVFAFRGDINAGHDVYNQSQRE